MLISPRSVHFRRPNGWSSLTNFEPTPVRLPAGARVLLSSSVPVVDAVPADTTVWYRP